MSAIKFIKMQGTGNDFILIDSRKTDLAGIDLAKLAIKLCDRNFGIGADGLLIVEPSKSADVKMRVVNPDGSEAEMCGNGIRCFAKYIYESLDKKKEIISVETAAGIMLPSIIEHKGRAAVVEVDMGEPKQVKSDKLRVESKDYNITIVNMGNPHCVIFTDDLAKVDIADVGSKIETNKMFPNRTNVEFAQVINKKEARIKVWERGAGETLACGTGACAVVVAGVSSKLLDREALVHLPGGNLDIEWQAEGGHIILRGPAETVFEGEIS